jgi:Uma2 family endonuclease
MSPLAARRPPPTPAKHRLTAAEFRRMAEVGILREDDRIELIEGELIDMAPIGSNHASVVARLNAWLAAAAGGRFIVFPQNPISLSEHSEPQPDLALLKSRDDYYRDALPTAQDVLLLIEVADATLEYDRTTKVPLYARSGIAEVWLVNLRGGAIEVFRAPGAQGYARVTRIEQGQSIAPLAFPDLVLQLDELFR